MRRTAAPLFSFREARMAVLSRTALPAASSYGSANLPRERLSPRLPRRKQPHPIVLGLDGRDSDRAVITAGRLLGVRTGSRLMAVSVRRRSGTPSPESPDHPADLPVWHTSIVGDGVALALVAEAMSADARLLIIGQDRHEIWDQLVQGEVSLEVVRRCERPVLVVDRSFTALPRTAVVGVTADDASRRTAAAAARMLDQDGTLYLAHVVEHGSTDQAAEQLVAARAAELSASGSVAVRTEVLKGSPSSELLSLARRTRAELVAVGVSGAHGRTRMYTGGVATDLLRKGGRSVLLVQG